MLLSYLSGSTIPSTAANSVHVMKMCNAFVNAGNSVDLYAYLHAAADRAAVAASYGVGTAFSLNPIFDLGIPLSKRIARMCWYATTAKRRIGSRVMYSRDAYGVYAAARALPTTRFFFEAHTPPRSTYERLFYRKLLSLPNFGGMVVISSALRHEYERMYGNLVRRMLVAHDGADVTESSSIQPIGLGGRDSTLQLGYVGSLLPGKGAELVLELANRLPKYDFHIVGGTAKQVEQLARGCVPTNLIMHGHVPHSQVPSYLAGFDIALFPAQKQVLVKQGYDIAKWMSPLKLFEYMAARKTIVCSDLAAVQEILTDGNDAVFCAPDDPSEWVAKIEALAGTPESRHRLAENAYSKLRASYLWEQRARDIQAFMMEQ